MNIDKTYFLKSELFKLFFLLLRGFYIYSAIMCLVFSFNSFELITAFLTMTGLFFIAVQFYLSIQSEKLILGKNYWGFILGLGLALFNLAGFGMPIACFGFYSLLNKDHRAKYLPEEQPLWLSDLLLKWDELISSFKAKT